MDLPGPPTGGRLSPAKGTGATFRLKTCTVGPVVSVFVVILVVPPRAKPGEDIPCPTPMLSSAPIRHPCSPEEMDPRGVLILLIGGRAIKSCAKKEIFRGKIF